MFNNGLGMATRGIVSLEKRGMGLTWDNVDEPLTPRDNPLSLNQVLLMFWLSGAAAALVAWYVENVFPGEYGQARPWYFCVTLDYWWPSR